MPLRPTAVTSPCLVSLDLTGDKNQKKDRRLAPPAPSGWRIPMLYGVKATCLISPRPEHQ
jgi:hypothetical protein